MNKRLVLAQFGCGYWGPNLLRNFSVLPDCSVKYVADKSADRRAFVERNFPQTSAIESCDRILEDSEVSAVIIATPAESHFSMAKRVLGAGKHVFVEKPLATKASEVDELSDCAAERNLIVMAGHTFIYNAAVRYVKQLIDAGRTKKEVEEWRQRDPIKRLREHLGADAAATLDAIDREIEQMATEALEWAKDSPYPDAATVMEHVYA